MTIVEVADIYLKYDYPDWKDLAKAFLTLASATLVFSITFSEKIVDFPRATPWERRLLFLCWLLLIGSIITCGLSICGLSLSASMAAAQLYVPSRMITDAWFGASYIVLANVATLVLGLAGAAFAAALLSLVLAAWLALRRCVVVIAEAPVSSPAPPPSPPAPAI